MKFYHHCEKEKLHFRKTKISCIYIYRNNFIVLICPFKLSSKVNYINRDKKLQLYRIQFAFSPMDSDLRDLSTPAGWTRYTALYFSITEIWKIPIKLIFPQRWLLYFKNFDLFFCVMGHNMFQTFSFCNFLKTTVSSCHTLVSMWGDILQFSMWDRSLCWCWYLPHTIKYEIILITLSSVSQNISVKNILSKIFKVSPTCQRSSESLCSPPLGASEEPAPGWGAPGSDTGPPEGKHGSPDMSTQHGERYQMYHLTWKMEFTNTVDVKNHCTLCHKKRKKLCCGHI